MDGGGRFAGAISTRHIIHYISGILLDRKGYYSEVITEYDFPACPWADFEPSELTIYADIPPDGFVAFPFIPIKEAPYSFDFVLPSTTPRIHPIISGGCGLVATGVPEFTCSHPTKTCHL